MIYLSINSLFINLLSYIRLKKLRLLEFYLDYSSISILIISLSLFSRESNNSNSLDELDNKLRFYIAKLTILIIKSRSSYEVIYSIITES